MLKKVIKELLLSCRERDRSFLDIKTTYCTKVLLLTSFLSMSYLNLVQMKLLPQMKLDGKHWSQNCNSSTFFFFFYPVWVILSRAVSCAQVLVMHVFLLYSSSESDLSQNHRVLAGGMGLYFIQAFCRAKLLFWWRRAP